MHTILSWGMGVESTAILIDCEHMCVCDLEEFFNHLM